MRKLPNRRAMLFTLAILLSFLATAQTPTIKVDNKEDPSVFLKSVDIDVKVVGNYSVTTMKMVFFNSTARILEGELTFPCPTVFLYRDMQ